MPVNFVKHKDAMLEAWKDVVDDKSPTDWAMYGYEKQTDDLKLVDTGEDGLEELAEEFNSGRIMYAFCRVNDPKTSLSKFVLINWQGEGAPIVRKGNCANHIHDVNNFFKGAHITINARLDDEVEPDAIIEKVSKSTGSTYQFNQRLSPENTPEPVSSVYKRVLPTVEINPSERDRFWEEQEKEEKKRVDEEATKMKVLRHTQERERKERELQEEIARDRIVKERSKSISEMRKAEKLAEQSANKSENEKQKWEKQMEETVQDDTERKKRSESLRDERKQEAQQLIGRRTSDARAIFEQNTSAGQMVTRRNSSSAAYVTQDSSTTQRKSSESKVPENIVVAEAADNSPATIANTKTTTCESRAKQQTPNKTVFQQNTNEKSSSKRFSYTKNLLKDSLPPRQDSDADQDDDDDANWDDPPLEDPPKFKDPLEILANNLNADQQSSATSACSIATKEHGATPDLIKDSIVPSKGLVAKALYDYQAADDTEISFDPDDIITHVDQIDEGWWQGVGPDGTFGLFPANYVELVSP